MCFIHLQDSVERGAFLRDLRRPEAGPRVPMMLAVALDIARAVEFLHSHGIVHGGACTADDLATCEPCLLRCRNQVAPIVTGALGHTTIGAVKDLAFLATFKHIQIQNVHMQF